MKKCSIKMDFSEIRPCERDFFYYLFKEAICKVSKSRSVDSESFNELIEIDIIEFYPGCNEKVEINNKMISTCWKIPSKANNENYK